MLERAEQANKSVVPGCATLPDDIKRREDRLKAVEMAKAKIEARAQARLEREQVNLTDEDSRIMLRRQWTPKALW